MDQLTDLFKILSDETRLRIVILLAQQEMCVCEICGVLELSQPKVSKHLAKLRDKGFVSDNRKRAIIYYKLKLNNNVLNNIISNIIDNMDDYPMLCSDTKKLEDKDIYSKNCKSN